MAAQLGSALLVKVGDGGSPTETFTSLASLRTKSLNINAEQVDISTSDSTSKMRELLAGAGIISLSVAGDGVFSDSTPDATLRTEAFAQTQKNYQVIVPDFGTFEGPFMLTALNYASEHNAEVTYDFSLESSGVISFTAA
jgi:TP901-1 family phage major tail protein